MRIIEICTANSLGGLELYFLSCCRQLKERGHTLLAIVAKGSKLHQFLDGQVDCFPVEPNKKSNFLRKNRAVRSFRPDVVHIHHKKDLLDGALLKQFGGVPYRYVHTRQMDLPRKKKNPYHNFIYSKIDLLIAITDRLKNQVIERVNIQPEKVTRLYYGVPKPEPDSSRCDKLNLDSTHFNIGVIARIDSKKEQHLIVEAVDLLKSRGISNVKAYLIGGSTDDEYLNQIKKMIEEKKLNDQIHLIGFKENPQQLMNCFDVIVLTTGNETFGLVLPEAMRMGVAVIGANGGGVPEIIDNGETGLLFEPGDSKSLSDQVTEMMDLPLRERLAHRGKEKADLEFELGEHFVKLEQLFRLNP